MTFELISIFAPLLLLAFGGLVVMLLDAFNTQVRYLGWLTALLCAASAVLAFMAPELDESLRSQIPSAVTDFISIHSMSRLSDMLIAFAASMSALLGVSYLREHHLERGEFFVIMLWSTFGAMVLARASDFIALFIALEIMSLGVYSLVAFRRTSTQAVEGGLKYFLLGSFAAALLLFGSALIYGATGSTQFEVISRTWADGQADVKLMLLGSAFVIAGLAFKVSAIPFHMWTPDAYQGAMTPVTAFMSVVVKASAFMIAMRVVAVLYGSTNADSINSSVSGLIVIVSVLSMVLANVAALQQTNLKRLLAYSSIAHAGYMLAALAVMPIVFSEVYQAIMYYLFAYAAANLLCFAVIIASGRISSEINEVSDLNGLSKRSPWSAIAMTLAILSLMGFPPTAGFFAKYQLFSTMMSAGADWIWLVVVAVLSSAVAAFYYLRVLVAIFMSQPSDESTDESVDESQDNLRTVRLSTSLAVVAVLMCIAIVVGGLAPTTLLSLF